MDFEHLIDVARGNEPADLVIKNTSAYCLTTGEIIHGDIAICDGLIAGVGEDYEGKNVLDAFGQVAVPGFIDAHVHVESSMVSPFEFERCVLPHGVTTAICDPHELANVCGAQALDYFIECARRMRMTLKVNISSCVPSTPLETAGASLDAASLERFADVPESTGLAELMNVPGVLSKEPDMLAKVKTWWGRIDGHAPLLSGKDLNAYLVCGVRNCHETNSLEEAQEKMRKGMQILIREGSVARNLALLMPLITMDNSPNICFCTDDRNPLDIAQEGHIDGMVARAIHAGCEPLAVYRAASISAARHFGLGNVGLIAPGYKADIVLLNDMATCNIAAVLKNGQLVDEAFFASRPAEPSTDFCRDSIHVKTTSADDFRKPATDAPIPVIGIREFSLLTDRLELELPTENGLLVPSPENDIAKIAVLERHGKNGNIAVGFVKGFQMKAGAIASSVGHDSHNICVVGVSDEDMSLAVNALTEAQGGFAVAANGKITGLLPLPLGGLMSDLPFPTVHEQLEKLLKAAKDTGCPLESPFLQLAFLPLPVIPHLRITDMGIVDVDSFRIIH